MRAQRTRWLVSNSEAVHASTSFSFLWVEVPKGSEKNPLDVGTSVGHSGLGPTLNHHRSGLGVAVGWRGAECSDFCNFLGLSPLRRLNLNVTQGVKFSC